MALTPSISKYTSPKLPSVITRRRLIKRLQVEAGRHLVLVIGQAAQGKTTLIADYLGRVDTPAAWLHLDAQDADSANFYQLFVCGLSHSLPEQEFEQYLEKTHISLGTSAGSVRYETLLNSIWQRIPEDMTIVLDGLEQIPGKAPSHLLMQRMINLAEIRGRVIILSRHLPPFKVQRWVMRRQIVTLDNDELAFTLSEIKDYFQAIHQFELSAVCADNLAHVTGGWVGGLVLVSQALSRRPRHQWAEFLSRQLPSSLADEAWRYFAEEIFEAQPLNVQELLIKASVLDEIDPDVLQQLFDIDEVTAILNDLVGRNLFLQIIYDADQRPLYRLNHLFQSFLRIQFQKRFDSAARREIYEVIADYYRDRRQAEAAVAYYLEAQNIDAAVDCIKKVGTDLVIRGRFADLEDFLSALPSDRIESDPWLIFLLTLTRRVKGGIRNIEDFNYAKAEFEKQQDVRGQMLALAFLIEAQVFAGHDPEACQRWIRQGETLLAEHSDTPYFAYARTLLWLQIGFGYVASGIDLSKGVSACQNAYLLAHKINDPRLMGNANIVAVLGLASHGEFERADQTLAKLTTFTDTDAYAEYNTLRGLVNVQLALHRGDLVSAQLQLAPLAEEIETFGLIFLYPAYIDTTGLLQIYQADFNGVRVTSRHLLDVATLSGNSYYEGLSHRLNAMRHYFQGRFHEAAAAASNAIDLLPQYRRPTLHWMRTLQLSGLIQIHLGKYAQAEDALQQCQHYFTQTANLLSLSETHLCNALFAHAQGDTKTAALQLGQGFSIAAERQYDHFVIVCPRDLKQCCRLALDCLDKKDTAWPEHLLSKLSHAPPQDPNEPMLSPTAKPVSEVEHDRLNVRDPSQPTLEIYTLGGFRVLRNGGVLIEDKQWGGNRTKSLLKAILVHGMQDIPKDILKEDLWPESSPSSANQNFKVTLHRLRKTLEPELVKHGRSAFIHLKDKLVSLDSQRCRVDVQQFLQCCKDIKRAAMAKEAQTIIKLGRQVIELYQGDFLPDDLYAPWAEMKRMALKDEYITTLMVMAEIYQTQDQLDAAAQCCRSVITADPCQEQANSKLMQLYIQQGRRNDAVKVYEQLQAILAADLGVSPDPAITKLYQSIRKS